MREFYQLPASSCERLAAVGCASGPAGNIVSIAGIGFEAKAGAIRHLAPYRIW